MNNYSSSFSHTHIYLLGRLLHHTLPTKNMEKSSYEIISQYFFAKLLHFQEKNYENL